MTKYSLELKLEIVADYQAGVGGYTKLMKKYGIDRTMIKQWVHLYQDFGIEGLTPKKGKQHYPVELKLNAIELYLETELSYRQVGVHLGITNPSLIANWMRTFKERGIDGLSQQVGRPPAVSKKKRPSDKKINQAKRVLPSSGSEIDGLKQRIQALEAANEQLDIENQFLKELRRLREADKRQPDNKQ